MYHILFIHSSVSGHLDCFHILAIVNSASLNIGVRISFRIMVFSGHMPRVGIAWSYGSFIFVFVSSLHTIRHRAVRVYIPQCRRVQFSSVTQFDLCNPMDCITPGFPVHHPFQELDQIHIHWSQWCHPTISSSVVPFSSCFQSFPASGSFPVNQFFASGGQTIGVSASVSILPMNIQDWFPLGWTGWISLQSRGLWRVFSSTTVQKHQFFGTQLSL